MPYFDEAAADRVCNFFERMLVPPEVGQLCKLPDWLRAALRHAYGTKNDDGTRVVRTLYFEIPKKNAKSFILSGLGLYHLAADGERAAHCICCAGSANQAGLVFDVAKKMAKAAPPALARQIDTFRFTLVHEKSGSKFETIAADAETAEGPKCSYLAFDELHVQRDSKLWDALRTSGLSRRQPMTVVATTAGASRQGIAWEVHERACRIRDGKLTDPAFLPVIYGWKDGDDPEDREVWKRCNPSYGITFKESDFETQFNEARSAGPARFASWQRYHLNRWQESTSAWLPMDRWSVCGQAKVDPASLEGRTCFPGVDLSSITDLTSAALLFPEANQSYQLLIYHWMPRGRVIEAERRDQVPYRQWAEQGLIELTDGDAIDQRTIHRRVMDLHKRFPFFKRQVRLDDYNAVQFIQDLSADGMTPVPVSAKAKGLSPPSKELLRLVIEGKLHHGGNPLLDWQAAQCSVVEDREQNIRPVKGKGEFRKRIDGILATVYALSGAMVNNRDAATGPRESVYSRRGVFTL